MGQMPKERPDYACADCGVDTDKLGEYSWIVHDALWKRSLSSARRRRGPRQVSQRDLTCIACFERRIHRNLTIEDFNWAIPLNTEPGHRSERLRLRMGVRFLLERKKRQLMEPDVVGRMMQGGAGDSA